MQVPQHKMALLQENCTICLEGYDGEDDDTRAVMLPCGHIFHSGCIVAWIDHGNTKCPICKRLIRPKKGKNGKRKYEGGEKDSDEEEDLIE